MADLNVSLLIKAVDQATRPIRGITKAIGGMNKAWKSADFVGLRKSLKGVGSALGGVGTAAKKTGVRLGVLGGIAGLGLKGLIDTASEFENLGVQMEALEGSAEAGKKAEDWVIQFATKTPASVKGLTKQYANLKNFGLDPMSGILQAVTDQTSKLGYTQEKAERIGLALGKAWSLQKLQGEQVNQLIEAGVPVYKLLEKALKKTTPQIRAMMSAGKIGQKEMKLLHEEMGKGAAGASAAMMKTWTGMVSNLGDQWDQIKKAIMGAGLFEYLKSGLSGALTKINQMAASGELKIWAKKIGDEIKRLIETAVEFGRKLKGAIEKAYALFKPLVDRIGGVNTALILLGAYTFGPLIASVVKLTGSFISLGKEVYKLVAKKGVPALISGLETLSLKLEAAGASTAIMDSETGWAKKGIWGHAKAINKNAIPALKKWAVTMRTVTIPAMLAKAKTMVTTAIPTMLLWIKTQWAAATATWGMTLPILAVGAAILGITAAIVELVRIWDQLDFGDVFKGITESFGENGILSTLRELFDVTKLLENYGLIDKAPAGGNHMASTTAAPLPAGLAGKGGQGGPGGNATINVYPKSGFGFTTSTKTPNTSDPGAYGMGYP